MLIILLLIFISFNTTVMSESLYKVYLDKGQNYKPRTKHLDSNNRAIFVNELILKDSPYLLQHAHNPVNWHSWSKKNLNLIKKSKKLIFLSIGYATCHWCHVMEEESFEDLEVAAALNKNFIAIKIDREIRPDIDAIFMEVAQLLNGSGGWPLNVILLPDAKAFFAFTYLPKKDLLTLLQQLQNVWLNKSTEVNIQAEKIANSLKENYQITKQPIKNNIVDITIKNILDNFDELQGGFYHAPKFPQEQILLLLLDEQKCRKNSAQLEAIHTTLQMMVTGGFYDVVGGGFHRYTTDNNWLIPHFEKMLYNQAQLSLVYAKAYKLTHNLLYKQIATQTINYVIKEMQNNLGGFYSATDADSMGKEGIFFTWDKQEIKEFLTKDEWLLFNNTFDITDNTLFENRHIIRFKNTNVAYSRKLNAILAKLYKYRLKRTPPLTDNKILLSWNALMLKSLTETSVLTNNKNYQLLAIKNAKYLYTTFYKNNSWFRVSLNNKVSVKALFTDLIYLADSYLSIFDTTQNNHWLSITEDLINYINNNFWDSENYGFKSSMGNELALDAKKEIYDGAMSASNAIAYQVLIKLFNRTNNNKYLIQAKQLSTIFTAAINNNTNSFSSFVLGLNYKKNELSFPQYLYGNNIIINNKQDNDLVTIKINLAKNWHINANQVNDKTLIVTQIIGNNIKSVTYPAPKFRKFPFSVNKLAIFENNITIKVKLKNNNDIPLKLSLQACNDKVCMPPKTLLLNY